MISAIVCVALGVWMIRLGVSASRLAKEMQQDINELAMDDRFGGVEFEPFTVGRN